MTVGLSNPRINGPSDYRYVTCPMGLNRWPSDQSLMMLVRSVGSVWNSCVWMEIQLVMSAGAVLVQKFWVGHCPVSPFITESILSVLQNQKIGTPFEIYRLKIFPASLWICWQQAWENLLGLQAAGFLQAICTYCLPVYHFWNGIIRNIVYSVSRVCVDLRVDAWKLVL